MMERGAIIMKLKKIGISFVAIVSVLAVGLVASAAGNVVTPVVTQPTNEKEVVNVTNYFDEEKDTTWDSAFQKALAEAKKSGKPVYVPRGTTYTLQKTLKLDGQTLIGFEAGPWCADLEALPSIHIDQKDGPGVEMSSGTVAGLQFVYAHADSSTFSAYQECIRITGSNSTVLNCKIANPTKGIVVDGKNIKNLRLENLFITQVHLLGVSVNGTVGKTILKNLEMWTAGVTINAGSPWQNLGVGVLLGDNEQVEMTDIFPFYCNNAFEFADVNGKGTRNALMVNCSSDMSVCAVRVGGSANVTIRGGTFWNHQLGLYLDQNSTGDITVNGAQFKTNGNTACNIENGSGQVTLTGCMFRRTMKGGGNATLVRILRDNVLLDGCLMTSRMDANGVVMEVADGLMNVEVKNCISQSTNGATFYTGGSDASIHDNVAIHNLPEAGIDT